MIINREEIECNYIFALWQVPDNIDEYKNIENHKDIITPDGIFYYGILTKLYESGYKQFDNMALHLFLSDKEVVRKKFEELGGYDTIQEITSLVNPDNIEIYHDNLIKHNMMLNLYNNGFNIMDEMDKIKNMTSTELYDYYDYKLNAICVNKIEKIHAEDLSEGYDEYIEEWDKGVMVGYRIGYGMLNYRLAGVHKKNLLLHMAHIGNGKTTSSILFYILPAIESGENVCIIANEQGISEFRQMILASVVFNKIKCNNMNRHKLIQGNFTPEQKESLRKGAEWLKNCEGKITFIETNDYSIDVVKKIIKKYSKLNHGLFVFDTLKPSVESSDRAWAEFSEVAKELFMLAKKEDVAIIATAQLTGESTGRKYLDLSCVGKSKAIAETATQVVMFRSMTTEEKKELKVYKFQKDENGKYVVNSSGNSEVIVPLEEDKDYIILFTPKNRFGAVNPQIVYQRNMDFNTMYEIGYTMIDYDFYNKR